MMSTKGGNLLRAVCLPLVSQPGVCKSTGPNLRGVARGTATNHLFLIQSGGSMASAIFERLEERRLLSTGGLDGSFGAGGKVVTDFSAGNDQGRQVVVAPDGKIVVIGNTTGPSGTGFQNFGLARYNTDGSLDASFGNGGKVITDFNNSFDFGLAVQIQSDGKILAAGVGGSSTTFVMARYNDNGTLDSTFGSGGKVTTTFASNPNVGLGLQNGKIILGATTAGNFHGASDHSNGSPGTTFWA